MLYKLSRVAIFLLIVCSNRAFGTDTARINKLLVFVDVNRPDSVRVFDSCAKLLDLTVNEPRLRSQYGQGIMAHGILLYYYGQYDSALAKFTTSRELFEKIQDSFFIAKSSRLEGIIYEHFNMLEKATERFLYALEIYEKLKNDKGMSEAYVSMAIVFQRRSLYPKALEYHKKALAISYKIGSEKLIGAINNNLGSLYLNLMEYDSSFKFLYQALYWGQKMKDKRIILNAYHNLGTASYRTLQFQQALKYYRLEMGEMRDIGMNGETTSLYVSLGQVFLMLGQLDSAEYYIMEGLEFEKQFPDLSKKSEIFYVLSDLEARRGNFKKAYEHMQEHVLLNDSNNILLLDEKLTEMQAQFLSQEKEKENETLKEIQKSQAQVIDIKAKTNTYLIILISALLTLIFVMFLNIKRIRANRRALHSLNTELENKHIDLENVIQEKNDLVGALAHDLRAPFSKIIGLSALVHEATNVDEKEEYLAMIENLGKDGLSLIQDLIDLSRMVSLKKTMDLDHNVKPFNLSEALGKLIKSYERHAFNKKINIILSCPPEFIINSKRDYFERVCDNVISNALKYTPVGSKIRIDVEKADRVAKIHVIDEGPGFSAADFEKLFQKFQRLSAKPTGLESSTGLGLFIARNLALALRGDIKLLSTEGESAHFCIEFPLDLEIKP